MFYNREFLDELFLNKERELYVKINLLTWDERKIKEIQGLITDGSLNVDGNSIIRRNLSLTLVLDPDIYDTFEIANQITISRKIAVEIGLKNNTYYGKFPDLVSSEFKDLTVPIVWFKLGVFVPTDVSLSHSLDNSSISVSGQDKMVLLNGDVAGELGYDIDFINTITRDDLPYQTIIKDAVSYFGGIDESKVVILDVPFYAESLTTIPTQDFTYVGSADAGTKEIYFDPSISLSNLQVGQTLIQILSGEANEGTIAASTTISHISTNSITVSQNVVATGGLVFYVSPATILYANTVDSFGKRTFDIMNGNPYTSSSSVLTPDLEPGKILPLQLTLSPQNKDTKIEVSSTDTVNTILDRVKSNLLGEYEYFFDIDGNFIFQYKKNLETQFSNLEIFQNDNADKYLVNFSSIPYIYNFSDKEIISTYNNTPTWKGIKNDFYVYGANNLLYHLAIDKIPQVPTEFYEQNSDGSWTNNLVPYNQPWQQYIIDLTEYNAQENPDIPESRYYAELIKYFQYNAIDNTGIYWKINPTEGIWRSDNKGEIIDYEFILNLTFDVECLVIAGGGGGAGAFNTSGGGGGAGGYRSSVVGESSGGGSSAESKLTIPIGTSVTVTVGAGGAGGLGTPNFGSNGANGNDSIFSSITSTAGGGGGAFSSGGGGAGLTGGSGGGAAQSGGTTLIGGSGTTNQGYAGGNSAFGNGSAGGGGAGAVGSNGVSSGNGATGGVGVSSAINGSTTFRAGGGGGYASAGGSGGGGAGGNNSNGTAGTANTGGGGGGAQEGLTARTGGAGGSGVVIIRYPSTSFDIAAIDSGLTYTKTTSGAYKIYTFTAGTGTITF